MTVLRAQAQVIPDRTSFAVAIGHVSHRDVRPHGIRTSKVACPYGLANVRTRRHPSYMKHLTDSQIETLMAALNRTLSKLERSMRTTEEALQPLKLEQTAVGRLSRIDSLQNQGLTRNLQERERAKLGQVITAFQRVESGTYGICTECGGIVPFERLEVFPETPTCTACSKA